MIIKKVYINVSNGQLLINIPRGAGIKPGDYVSVRKVPVNKEVTP